MIHERRSPYPLCELNSLIGRGLRRFMMIRVTGDGFDRSIRVPVPYATYSTLGAVMDEFGAESRYRLSLNCSWNPSVESYVGSVRAIDSMGSHIRYFPCSQDLAQRIECLRNNKTPEELESESCYPGVPLPPLLTPARVYLATALLVALMTVSGLHGIGYGSASALPDAAASPNPPDPQGISAHRYVPGTHATDTTLRASFGGEPESIAAKESPGDPERDETAIARGVVSELPPGYVALTFDDGPSRYTEKIIDVMVAEDITGTFFFIGQHAVEKPEAVEYAREKGMSVGNHSWSHRRSDVLEEDELRDEVAETNALLSSITGECVEIYRPPYGIETANLRELLADEGMLTVMWNRDPEDWRGSDASNTMEYLQTHPSSGCIYLFHENRSTLETLPDIIRYLRDQGLEFVVFD